MIYLSNVTAGGRTVFTSTGVSVVPKPGSVLLWMNHRSDGSLDSRSYHTGCPVLGGNKWIANKWVKCGHILAVEIVGDVINIIIIKELFLV